MIVGRFEDNERLLLPITIFSGEGEPKEIEATIDTGFIGCLLLPYAMAQRLELPRIGGEIVMLADGTMARLPVYSGAITWNDEEREIEILVANRDFPLIGIELLRGCVAHFEFFDGGDVTLMVEG